MPAGGRTVDILLATYNGARFLPGQLASIEQQTYRDWRVIARDDGSNDDSRAILAEFRARNPTRVNLVEDADRRLGPNLNFARLLERSSADYIAFCDQDDVWQPEKVATLVDLAIQHERPGVPLLVHSDLEVVDEQLHTVAPSFWAYQFIRPERCRWSNLLVQNVVTGCASLINRPLRDAASPISPDAIMHDWWIVLVAAMAGEIHWTPHTTVRYRQHGANDIGVKPWTMRDAATRGGRLLRTGDYRRRMIAYQRQAAALAELRTPLIAPEVRQRVREFGALGRCGYLRRVSFLLRHRILKTGLARNLALLAAI